MPQPRVTRRAFLKAGAAAAASISAPIIVPATALGLDGRAAPSERIVLAAIGAGGRGQQNLAAFLPMPDVQVSAVADVDRRHAEAGAALVDKQYGNSDCRRLGDYRELFSDLGLDAVCVSTPDHWHALICVSAANAGKDIYCETPLANSIGESRVIRDTLLATGRILQCGTQERSNPKVRYACELVRRGYLGDLRTVRIQMPTDQPHHEHVRKALEVPPPEPVPDALDFDYWSGPAPKEPYVSGRCHFWWRFIRAYGGGEMTDRGGHLIDLARLGARKDDVDPVSIKATGARNPSGIYDAYLSFEFVDTYDDGLTLIGESKGLRGLRFEGSAGTLFVGVPGGTLEAEPKGLLETKIEGFDPAVETASHHRNFIDCVKSRQRPVAPVDSADRTATICHLNNIALILGRELRWDANARAVVGDERATAMLHPAMRTPWTF